MHSSNLINTGGCGSLLRVNAAFFTDLILDSLEAEREFNARCAEFKAAMTHAEGWPHVINSDD